MIYLQDGAIGWAILAVCMYIYIYIVCIYVTIWETRFTKMIMIKNMITGIYNYRIHMFTIMIEFNDNPFTGDREQRFIPYVVSNWWSNRGVERSQVATWAMIIGKTGKLIIIMDHSWSYRPIKCIIVHSLVHSRLNSWSIKNHSAIVKLVYWFINPIN